MYVSKSILDIKLILLQAITQVSAFELEEKQ